MLFPNAGTQLMLCFSAILLKAIYEALSVCSKVHLLPADLLVEMDHWQKEVLLLFLCSKGVLGTVSKGSWLLPRISLGAAELRAVGEGCFVAVVIDLFTPIPGVHLLQNCFCAVS